MKMSPEQKKEVEDILDRYKVGDFERKKVISFLNSKTATVKIPYDANYKLKKSLPPFKKALEELQAMGYNVKFEIKGLFIRLEYLYQADAVQVISPLETKEQSGYVSTNFAHEINKQKKLGSLLLQRLLNKMRGVHPLLNEMDEKTFVDQINQLLIEPLAQLITNDKDYEWVLRKALNRIYNSKTSYEFKTVCNASVQSAEENIKSTTFRNVLISMQYELSDLFKVLDKDQKSNMVWKLKKLLPYVYVHDKDKFIVHVSKLVDKLKQTDNYDKAMDVLNHYTDSLFRV